MKLTQSKIVQAALDLLRDEGLEALNMRSLAARLHVQQSSLYRHVANKDDLISLMVNTLHRSAFRAVPPTPDWRAWLVGFGSRFHQELRDTRDSAKLCVLAGPWPESVNAVMDELSAPLADSGISQSAAMTFHAAVVSFTLGWLSLEQNERFRDHLGQMIDFDAGFDIGLRALAYGFRERDALSSDLSTGVGR